jgi:hypothetical protein
MREVEGWNTVDHSGDKRIKECKNSIQRYKDSPSMVEGITRKSTEEDERKELQRKHWWMRGQARSQLCVSQM